MLKSALVGVIWCQRVGGAWLSAKKKVKQVVASESTEGAMLGACR